MSLKQCIVFASVGLIYLVCVYSQTVFKTTNIECFPNPKYAENSTCLVKARNWNMAVAQMDCDLVKPLRNMSIHIEIFKRGYNNGYHPFLVNAVVNMCDFFSKRNYLTYGSIVSKVLKEFTNVNHSCPIKGHLIARNLHIRENLFPNPPLGFYRCTINILENFAQGSTEPVGTVHFYWETKEMVKPRKKPNTKL